MPSETEYVDHAKLSEQCERYEDMAQTMKEMLKEMTKPLTEEQRNLLSVAYKNVVGPMRSAWRIISSILAKSEETGQEEKAAEAKRYREKIEGELEKCCAELLDLVKTHLLPKVNDDDVEAKVFYTKMMGDYYRYLTEVANAEKRPELVDRTRAAYDGAADAANELASTHPIKLGLALNRSVFYYEIENDSKKACELAKKAFDNAIAELDNLKEESYKDSTLIMQLLRDNLTLWTSENENDQAEDDEN